MTDQDRESDGHPRAARPLRYEVGVSTFSPSGSGRFEPATFAIRLPFNLALPDRTALTLRRSPDPEDPPWVELLVRRVAVSLREAALSPYESGLARILDGASHLPSEGNSVQTWVMATTINCLFSDEGPPPENEDQLLTVMFERGLSAVNRLARAEQLMGGNPWVRPLAKESLDRQITCLRLQPGRPPRRLPFRLHARPTNPAVEAHDPAAHLELVKTAVGRRLASDAAVAPHPLVLARELTGTAVAQRLMGDLTGCIITLQAAAETYLRGIDRLLHVDAGASQMQIDLGGQVPFATLLNTRLPSALGGDWTSAHSKPTAYRERLYELRNALTHGGVEPTWQQAQPAFDAHQRLIAFVEHQVAAGWRSRPRTLLAVCEPWAGGTRLPPKPSAAVLSGLLAEPKPYWLAADTAGRPPAVSKD